MNTRLPITVLGLIVIGSALAVTTQPNRISGDTSDVQQWGIATNGCRMRVISPVTSLKAGDAFDVTVEIENNGTETVRLLEPTERPSDNFLVSISNPSGRKVDKTSYSKDKLIMTSGGRVVSFHPGEHFRKSVRLNRIYDFSFKDDYSITICYKLEVKDKVTPITAPSFTTTITDDDATKARGWEIESGKGDITH